VNFPAGAAESSTRIVRQRGRGARLVAGVAVAALAVAGAVRLTGGDDPPRPARPTATEAYEAGAARLLAAWSFAYRGTVHAAVPTDLRPGPEGTRDATVEGTVHLPLSITRERAVDARGDAVEVATSGASVWSRSATSAGRLADAAWAAEPTDPTADRLGMALIADAVRSAGGVREADDGDDGRVLRAVLPVDENERRERCRHCRRLDAALAGGRVTVTLDAPGDVTRAEIRSPDGSVQVALDLDVRRTDDLDALDLAGIAAPARDALPVADLTAAAFTPVELGVLPTGWALTDARIGPGTSGRGPACAGLSLQYHDLRAGWRSMSLFVTTADCPGPTNLRGHPFTIGAFTGTIVRGDGVVSDGTTQIRFQSFLSEERAAALLSSLQPFASA
jgi:hypothetical protein